jgi:tripartite ATP-independent transporter DctM subunit
MIVAITFVASTIIGIPIALVLGLSGMAHLASINPDFLIALPQKFLSSSTNYSLLAIPLFILAGELMELSGDVERLCNLARVMVGSVKGSLGYITVALGALLGGPLGSANGEAALLSNMLYPELVKDKYGETFSACLIATTSIIGPLIPPGMIFVIYGVQSGVSIRSLFLAALSSGILLTIALFLVIFFVGRKRDWPVGEKYGVKDTLIALKGAAFSLITPAVTLVAIATGICTATEAAAVLSMLIFLVGTLIYRTIKLRALWDCLIKSTIVAASVLIIASMGGLFGYTLALDLIPFKMARFMVSLSDNPYVILLLINIFLLFVGMLMDGTPAIIIMVPVFQPIIVRYGFNPIHFGLIVCLNLCVGLLTPPVGTVLYTTAAATGINTTKIVKGIAPWCAVVIIILLIVTYIPQTVMWLPNLLANLE